MQDVLDVEMKPWRYPIIDAMDKLNITTIYVGNVIYAYGGVQKVDVVQFSHGPGDKVHGYYNNKTAATAITYTFYPH